MKRRYFLTMLGGAAVVWPFSLRAQPASKLRRVGFIFTSTQKANARQVAALRHGLRELGWVDGKNIVIEERYAEGKKERLADLAADLVRIKIDVIVVNNGDTALAAKRATDAVPVVLAGLAAPVESGLVASLARPGGNVTGLSLLTSEATGKRLQLLKEAIPGASHIGVLLTPAEGSRVWKEALAAAPSAGLVPHAVELRGTDDIDNVLSAIAKARYSGVFVIRSSVTRFHARRIIDFTAKHRIPTMFDDSLYVLDGGLMSYGPDLFDVHRRAATYVDKILKGAKPADLPIEQPTKFELVVNLKTANAIGLKLPQELLLRADRVIE